MTSRMSGGGETTDVTAGLMIVITCGVTRSNRFGRLERASP